MTKDIFIFRIMCTYEPGRFIYNVKDFYLSSCLSFYACLFFFAHVACRNLASTFKADKAL